jgi:hypothetical protein
MTAKGDWACWIWGIPEQVFAPLTIEIGPQIDRKRLWEGFQRQGVGAFVVRHSEPHSRPPLDPVEHSVPGQGRIPVDLLGALTCAVGEHLAKGEERRVINLFRSQAAEAAKARELTQLGSVARSTEAKSAQRRKATPYASRHQPLHARRILATSL